MSNQNNGAERLFSDGNSIDGDEVSSTVLDDVASLINDNRDTHGDAVINQEHIAQGWTWYLQGNGILSSTEEISGSDVARMMELLKMSRLCVGEYDADHDLDRVGYAGIATACEILRGNVDVDEQEVLEMDGVTITIEEDESGENDE